VLAQPVPIPVQPPSVINTPPTIFGQPSTTHDKTPWQLCQSLPLSCGIGGGTTGASQPNTGAANTNTAQTTASPTTPQGASNGLSVQGCLQGDSLGANGLCIHTYVRANTPQQQLQIPQQQQQPQIPQQQQQPQYPYNYQQQQIPTANFLPPQQQQLQPQVRPVPAPSITAYQHTSNGTDVANCNVLNDTRCYPHSYLYQNNNGNTSSNIVNNNGLSGTNLDAEGHLALSLNSKLVRNYGLWSFDPWIQNIVK